MQNGYIYNPSLQPGMPTLYSAGKQQDRLVQSWLEAFNTCLWMLILMTVVHTLLSSRVSEDDLRSINNSINPPVAFINLVADLSLLLLILPIARTMWRAFLAVRPLALFVFLTLISAVWSVNPAYTLRRAFYFQVTVVLATYFGLRFPPTRLCRILVASVAALAVISCVAFVIKPSSVIDPSHAGQWMGVAEHKNVFGVYISFGLVFALLTDLGKWASLRIPLCSLLAILLFLSHSTTSWLLAAICLGSIPFLMLVRHAKAAAIPLVCILVALLLLISLLTLPIGAQIMLVFGKDSTLTGRTDLWLGVLRAIAKQPILGYGYEAFFSDTNLLIGLQEHAGWLPPNAHNGYLQVLIGLGLLGGVLALWFIFYFLITAIRFAQRTRKAASILPIMAAIFWLLHNAVEVSLMQGQSLIPFMMFAMASSMTLHPNDMEDSVTSDEYTLTQITHAR